MFIRWAHDFLPLIAIGGAIGSVARFATTEWVLARWPAAFPWGTLLVNVLGNGTCHFSFLEQSRLPEEVKEECMQLFNEIFS